MERMRSICVRFNTKVMFTVMTTSFVCFIISLWLRNDCSQHERLAFIDGAKSKQSYKEYNDFDDDIEPVDKPERVSSQKHAAPIPYSPIPCVINEESKISCRREDEEIFVPFSFIHQYFEVYGNIVDGDEVKFDWQHSYSVVYPQRGQYHPTGVFMSFEHYNVETRSRVKCITATDGVPLSRQWGPAGYYYAIQIAQYGLSHYSKQMVEEAPRVVSLDDFEHDRLSDSWSVPDGKYAARIVRDGGRRVLEFDTDIAHSPGVTLAVGKKPKFVLSLKFRFVNNGSIVVVLKSAKNERVTLNYVQSSNVVSLHGQDVYYGLGPEQTKWRILRRDIVIDYTKGIQLKFKKSERNQKQRNLVARLVSVTFHGHGFVDDISLATSSHMSAFYSAADWLVGNQDNRGGWPIAVSRRLVAGVMELKPGWYSAMAQGQAMSTLVRAYEKTKNRRYLTSAIAASELFKIPSAHGGIFTSFAGAYDWYEEYPTIPSSYVLNGFIFSLIGLYDLQQTAVREPEIKSIENLYSRGMRSLRALLNLFDTGSGSMYDLRHYSAGLAPNLARWDYHATHIIQLNLLATIDDDPVFKRTADRWHGYMKGHRANHN